MRLDNRDRMPAGMEDYLAQNGWHFNKKMCNWAVSKMKKKDASGKAVKITPYSKEDVENVLNRNNVKLENDWGYDAVYVANMCIADFLGSAILDEARLALYIKDVIDDPDGYDGMIFTRFYSDCIGSGRPIMWEDML